MRQKLGLMKQSMTSDKSDKIKWKEIGIISLISALISIIAGIFLIHYEIFVTNDEPSFTNNSPQKLASTPVVSENLNTSLPDGSTHPNNQTSIISVKQASSEAESWYQLGERYYQQGQLPLSLEAFSHICQTDPMAKKRIKALLKNNRYATVEKDRMFNSESLLVLYDKQRQQALNDRLSDCDLDAFVPPQIIQPSECQTDDNLVNQLKCLHNPQTPFTISLWLDQPGQKLFNRYQKVTIGYQVNGLKTGTSAYLTLLNISPSGQLTKIFSEPIEMGKVYGQLTEQSNVASVKQINLEVGQEYFKAIVTSEPIVWEEFIKAAINREPPVKFWGTVELKVNVK
jgi:hypothetical protein